MKPDISDAIIALGFNGGFKIKENKIAVWYRDDVQPAQSEIDTKLVELQADYDAKQYQRDRQPEYPSMPDQLDMLYWDKKNDTKNWEDAIDKVKADNPKPE